mgnify:CR=1 FL=1
MTTTKNGKVAKTTENLGWCGIFPHLFKAQMDVQDVQKDTQGYQYKYAKAEDMYLAARETLHKNGLFVSRTDCEMLTQLISESDGIVTYTSKMAVVYIITHVSGHWVQCRVEYPIVSKGGMMEDKALNASLTTCLSYFLRDLLMIPRCDVEVDQRPDTISKTGTRITPKPKKKSNKSKKQIFMGNVAQWINRDIAENDTAEACIVLLKQNDLPVDGTATPKQFEEIAEIVATYIDDGVSPASILTTDE